MEKRIKKQISYGLLYLIIFSAIGAGIYFRVRQKTEITPPILAPKDIEIIWARQSMQPNTNECDLVAQIKNPNPYHFATQINYQFILYGLNNQIMSQIHGVSWILPNQAKYIIANEVVCSELAGAETVSRIIFKTDQIQWETYNEYHEPQIQIFQKDFQKLTQGPPYAQVSAIVANKNEFNLTNIKINIILEDANNNLIAARQTQIDNLVANQETKISYQWLTEIKENVYRLTIEPDLPITNDFLK